MLERLLGFSINPLYEYVGQGAQDILSLYGVTPQNGFFNNYGYNLTSNGIFAKSAPLTVDAGSSVELRSDAMPVDNGVSVLPGGSLMLTPVPQWVCVEEFVDLEGFDKREEDETADYLGNHTVFPNPAKGGSLLFLTGLDNGEYTFELFDVNGRKVMPSNQIILKDKQNINIQLPTSIPAGLYIMYVTGENTSKTFKISVL